MNGQNGQGYYSRANSESLENVPRVLREYPQWICWREETSKSPGKKPPKVPVDPQTLRPIDPHASASWMHFGPALLTLERNPAITGIGIDLAPQNPLAGVDIDNCRNRQTGAMEAWAADLISLLDSYTEVSPSGTGVKIFVKADLTGRACHFVRDGREIEAYSTERYFAVTGEHVEGTPSAINDRQTILESLLPAEPERTYTTPADRSADPLAAAVDSISDEELLRRIEKSRQGEKFKRLMSGSTEGYAGYFAASGALCTILAAWTRLNPERIDRIARTSGLIAGWEDRWWDKNRRGEKTVAEACAFAANGGYA